MTSSSRNPGERVKSLSFPEGKDALSVELEDGRTITVPLAWYPRLLRASAKERSNWERLAAAMAGLLQPPE